MNTDAELDLLSQAVVQAYVNMDDELRKLENVSVSGSTCVLVIITPSHILCANVGDSRCVLGTKIEKKNQIHNVCIALSEDHKPSLPEEKLRISEAGGFVADDRVNGELAMSRALGDFVYKGNVELAADKQAVICYPDIAIQRRTPHDGVLILACDGVWDVVSNDDAVSYLQDIVLQSSSEKTNSNNKNENGKNKTGVRCQEAAQSLVSLSLGMGSMDNISVIAVNFQPNPQALAAEE